MQNFIKLLTREDQVLSSWRCSKGVGRKKKPRSSIVSFQGCLVCWKIGIKHNYPTEGCSQTERTFSFHDSNTQFYAIFIHTLGALDKDSVLIHRVCCVWLKLRASLIAPVSKRSLMKFFPVALSPLFHQWLLLF